MAEPTLTIDLDGDKFTLRLDEITPAQAGALRQQSHGAWRVPTLLAAVEEGTGPEELAALVFLAARQSVDPLTYDEACALVEKGGRAEVNFQAGDDPEDDSPEA